MMKYTEKELLKVMIRTRKIETIYLDNSHLKKLFNVCDRTLFRWRKSGKLPFEQKEKNGKIFYRLHEILNSMQSPSKN